MRRLALIAAAGIALAGCGGGGHPTSSRPRSHSHPPVIGHTPVVSPAGNALRHLVQLVSSTRLGIVTTGSSSCPSVPDELVVQSVHAIRIHLTVGSWDSGRLVAHPPPNGVCTADYGTTSMVVTIDPKLIDVHRPLTVRFFSKGGTLVRVAAPLS